ncbi:Acetyltransferase (GNAT) family protein [compost metagenome]
MSSQKLNFLFDTNILIPLEPASGEDARTGEAVELLRLILVNGHNVFSHPASLVDLSRDSDTERRRKTELLVRKYPVLPNPPEISPDLWDVIGNPTKHSNDWVDNSLIAALAADAVDVLITEDKQIIRKSYRLGLSRQVLSIKEAKDFILSLHPSPTIPPPTVVETKVHALNPKDQIFEGLRVDYPGFDEWLKNCRREHRDAWVIPGENGLAALCIYKSEASVYSIRGKILKLSTFKVSNEHYGNRYGELLFKAIFNYAFDRGYQYIYFTVFEKHEELIHLAEEFGFRRMSERTKLGESVLVKSLTFSMDDLKYFDSLQFNILFGPRNIKFSDGSGYLVPIQPRFHRLLFPEFEPQLRLLPASYPFGNSLKKAYLCNAQVRKIVKGDILVFYRSGDLKAATALGVVEDAIASSSPSEISRFVGNRTVYSYQEIEELCSREVLAILFRQSQFFSTPIPFEALRSNGVLAGAPQSIVTVPDEGIRWIEHLISM